jgi:hypothetical protein
MTTDSQCSAILTALRKGRAITPADALRDYGCFRLSARIYDLRKMGHKIENTWQQAGNKRWARYVLLREVAA